MADQDQSGAVVLERTSEGAVPEAKPRDESMTSRVAAASGAIRKDRNALGDIKRFRQLDSKCAGHPEYRLAAGVETTIGPLGHGCATSIGAAIAGERMAKQFNRPDFSRFDYYADVLCSDGDLMEGVSSEAGSLAGHPMLGNLCWIYDSNRAAIEGATALAFSADVAAWFLAYGRNHDAGITGAKSGMHTFGSSAPFKNPLRKFGFTSKNVLVPHRRSRPAGHETAASFFLEAAKQQRAEARRALPRGLSA